jgi:hypothetical protein
VWKRVFKLSPAFLIGLTTAIILHLAALFTPLGELLHITTISLGDLAHITGIGIVVPLIVIETHKLVGRMFFKKGTPIK